MSNNGNKTGRGGGKRFRQSHGSNETEADGRPKASEDTPLGKMFHQFQVELDQRHDKYERLVKISRDITIDSKRIIFQLHRIDSDESKQKTLAEAQQKLHELQNNKWYQVAVELQGEDPYQFLRAYSPGLQEYVEALSFLYYIEQHSLLSLQQVEANLTFAKSSSSSETASQTSEEISDTGTSEESTVTSNQGLKVLSVHVPPMEYVLGLADLTGELMRLAIGCIGRGEFVAPFELCQFIQSIYTAFLSFGSKSRDLMSKFTVLRQSMRKVEDACYALQVRGSEMPKHLLADCVNSFTTGASSYETASDICSDYVD